MLGAMRGLTFVALFVVGCGAKQQQPTGKAFDEDLTMHTPTPAPAPAPITTVIDTNTPPVPGRARATPVVTSKTPTTPTTPQKTPAKEPEKPTVAPTPPRASCLSDEHEYMGRCVRCPPLSEYAGNGKCRQTIQVPRDCSEYVVKPPACR
jgi:hypothetical protein